ncbi:MAG: DUF4198 domain-containing protein, partial [Desulfovibrio sp.]|nr:DUF4198 domain-containing protein [Desulfovibrio sp.]
MKKLFAACACAAIFLSATATHAHFGMLIPSKSCVLDKKDQAIELTFAFAHPFEGKGMNLEIEKAQAFA